MTRHPMRWDALVFGLLFAVVVAAWALLSTDAVSPAALRVAGPVILIVAGLAGIALTFRRKS